MSDHPNPTNPMNDGTWPNTAHHPAVPDTSMLPGAEKALPAAVNLLHDAVQGAHERIDRLAHRVEPAVRQIGEQVSKADEALKSGASQLRQTGDAWADGLRQSVRSRPLASVGLALALGVLVARIAR